MTPRRLWVCWSFDRFQGTSKCRTTANTSQSVTRAPTPDYHIKVAMGTFQLKLNRRLLQLTSPSISPSSVKQMWQRLHSEICALVYIQQLSPRTHAHAQTHKHVRAQHTHMHMHKCTRTNMQTHVYKHTYAQHTHRHACTHAHALSW